ncbi:hypothetical protein LINPERHAP2_LOCUS10907 [Linum perenne]
MLKLAEVCKNGKLFFILIPWDPVLGGWRPLLNAIQPQHSAPSCPLPSKSFAEVVRRQGLPEGGLCRINGVGEDRSVQVEEAGVQERLTFLERCLVFRFSDSAEVVWSEFLRWAVDVWGISPDAPFSRLSDDLWLLDVSSVDEVSRILSLNRWRFGSISILMDRWFKGAGRSSVLADKGVCWFYVSGIPVHLRSPALFQSLGELCGDFLGFEKAGDLNSIRIKVSLKREMPSGVDLKFGEDSFRLTFFRDDTFGRSAASVFGVQASSVDDGLSSSPPLPVSSDSGELSELTVACPGEELSMGCFNSLIPRMAEGLPTSILRGKRYVGLCVGANGISLSVPPIRPNQLVLLESLLFSSGLLCSALGPHSLGPKIFNLHLGPWSFSSSLGLEATTRLTCPSGIFVSAPLVLSVAAPSSLSLPSSSSTASSVPPLALLEAGSSAPPAATSPVVDLAPSFDPASSLDTVESEVKTIATIIGLSLNGSSEEGIAAALATCASVRARKASTTPRSKKEMEFRRLGIEDGEVSVPRRRESRNRFGNVSAPVPNV